MTTIHSYNFNSNINNDLKIKKQQTSNPSFGAQQPNEKHGISSEAAESLKAQRIQTPSIPHITEKDINFEVTLRGYSNINGNSRKVYDFRCPMSYRYGLHWYNNFHKPMLLRNANGDEKRNGETTAIVIPLHPKTEGYRSGDHMTLLLNGNIPTQVASELIDFMTKVGILNKTPLYNKTYYVNSTNPDQFMSNPKIKTAIAAFFRQKEKEIKENQQTQKTEQKETKETQKEQTRTQSKTKINTTHINIANIGRKQNVNNTRTVENYQRYFLENNREFTVVYDQYNKNGRDIDVTAILLPSKKSPMDCITITIDKKLDKQTCKNLINHLVKQNITSVDNPNFRKEIVEYLNDL